MNITDIGETFKRGIKNLLENDEFYTLLLMVLVGGAAFGLGRASVEPVVRDTAATQTASLEQSRASGAHEESKIVPEAVEDDPQESASQAAASSTPGQYVASKTGSKYHFPWCGGAKQIKEENKVWFQTKEEAEAAGYTPAANCKGI